MRTIYEDDQNRRIRNLMAAGFTAEGARKTVEVADKYFESSSPCS